MTYPSITAIVLIGWISFGLIDWLATPQITEVALAIRFGLVVPISLAFFLIRNNPKAIRYMAYFPSFVFITGSVYAYILGVILDNEVGMLWRVFPIIFVTLGPAIFGLTMQRTLIYGFMVIAFFLFFEIVWRPDSFFSFVFIFGTLLLSVLVASFGTYLLHKIRRHSYYQSLLIDWQMQELDEERSKSERLLENILPASIAHRLKNKETVIADKHNNISVLFADIVGFTTLSSSMKPEKLVGLLNVIFSAFDAMTSKYEVEKIKTIGDSYMASSGLPDEAADHAARLANMALEMQQFMLTNPSVKANKLEIRIGIHSGEAVAGVIGAKKFVYDLWGDTVNVASRFESHGTAGKIQVSRQTRDLLQEEFICEPRGWLDIKGKGEMEAFYLTGKK